MMFFVGDEPGSLMSSTSPPMPEPSKFFISPPVSLQLLCKPTMLQTTQKVAHLNTTTTTTPFIAPVVKGPPKAANNAPVVQVTIAPPPVNNNHPLLKAKFPKPPLRPQCKSAEAVIGQTSQSHEILFYKEEVQTPVPKPSLLSQQLRRHSWPLLQGLPSPTSPTSLSNPSQTELATKSVEILPVINENQADLLLEQEQQQQPPLLRLQCQNQQNRFNEEELPIYSFRSGATAW